MGFASRETTAEKPNQMSLEGALEINSIIITARFAMSDFPEIRHVCKATLLADSG